MKKHISKLFLTVVLLNCMIFISGCITKDTRDTQDTQTACIPEDALTVFELLENQEYDTEVKIYGKASLIGELFCPCFQVTSDLKSVQVWHGLMVDQDTRTEWPTVNIEGIKNGDWVIVTGELKFGSGATPNTAFWAKKIEKTKNIDTTFTNLQDCQSKCIEAGYEKSECRWPAEAEVYFLNLGPCLINQSRHCGNEGQCNCYCYNIK